jgi:hypothetical protein
MAELTSGEYAPKSRFATPLLTHGDLRHLTVILPMNSSHVIRFVIVNRFVATVVERDGNRCITNILWSQPTARAPSFEPPFGVRADTAFDHVLTNPGL